MKYSIALVLLTAVSSEAMVWGKPARQSAATAPKASKAPAQAKPAPVQRAPAQRFSFFSQAPAQARPTTAPPKASKAQAQAKPAQVQRPPAQRFAPQPMSSATSSWLEAAVERASTRRSFQRPYRLGGAISGLNKDVETTDGLTPREREALKEGRWNALNGSAKIAADKARGIGLFDPRRRQRNP